jgi:hypothetical protein
MRVQVVRLDREVDQPEPFAYAPHADAPGDDCEAGPRAETRRLAAHARRHVNRVPRGEGGPAQVRYSGSALLRPAGAGPVTAASSVLQLEPELFRLSLTH